MTCVALRHVLFEDLGSFEEPIKDLGYRVEYLEAGTGGLERLEAADLAVILGGPIGVYETKSYPYLTDEIATVKNRMNTLRPTLGICLGAQIIAVSCGAKVYPGQKGKEIGWAPLQLTDAGQKSLIAPLGDAAPVLHWHGDTFNLPDDADLLASSEKYSNQVFSIGNHALAFQCHPEFDANDIEKWLIGHANELTQSGFDPEKIRKDSNKHGKDLRSRGIQIISSWIKTISPDRVRE